MDIIRGKRVWAFSCAVRHEQRGGTANVTVFYKGIVFYATRQQRAVGNFDD